MSVQAPVRAFVGLLRKLCKIPDPPHASAAKQSTPPIESTTYGYRVASLLARDEVFQRLLTLLLMLSALSWYEATMPVYNANYLR